MDQLLQQMQPLELSAVICVVQLALPFKVTTLVQASDYVSPHIVNRRLWPRRQSVGAYVFVQILLARDYLVIDGRPVHLAWD